MPDPSDYDWLEEVLQDAACLTVVVGAGVADVLAAFGADTSTELDSDDAYESDGGAVAARAIPGGVLVVELNGFQGSLEEVLVQVAALGPTASMFWNVNDDNAFSCARDGALVATVDMYDAEDADEVDLPDDLMPLFLTADLDDEDVDLHAIGMAMVEQFTGLAVPRDAVEGIAPFHPIG